jgi:hypothetical protein
MSSLGYVDWQQDSEAPDQVEGIRRYWGKYRGVVRETIDPEMRCRLLVEVVDVFGPRFCNWAEPCVPWAGPMLGMYIVPAIGANVWVEFLHGDPQEAIWTGFWFAEGQAPTAGAVPGMPVLAVKSFLEHTIVISDTPVLPYLPFGGILLKCGTESCVAIDATGVRLFGATVQANGTETGIPPSAAALAVFK